MTTGIRYTPLALALLAIHTPQAYATQAAQSVQLASAVSVSSDSDEAEAYPDGSGSAPPLVKVVVTAAPLTQPAAVLRLDPRQAIQPLPASDGAAYLKTIMGFNGIQSGGTNSDVTFRGMFGSRIKVLVNGAENLGACPNRMDAPTSYIAPESFDQVSIIKGPQSVLHPMGSAATVNFERNIPRRLDQQPLQGQASTVVGSFGRLDHNLSATVGNAVGYAQLDANRSVSDSYLDGQGELVPSAWSKWNVDGTLGWTPTEHDVIRLYGGQSDGNALYGGRMMDGSRFRRQSVGLQMQHQWVDSALQSVQAQIDYSDNDHVMDNFSLRPFKPSMMMNMPMAMDVARQSLNARTQVNYNISRITGKSGLDWQQSRHSGRMGMGNDYVNQPYEDDADFRNLGAFSEWSVPLSQQYSVVTGARVDQTKVDDLRQTSSANSMNTTRHNTAVGGFIRLEQRSKRSGWMAGIGHVERMPDYWELFTPVHGNSGSSNTFNGVKPEQTTQLDLAYRYQAGQLRANAAAYVGRINDFILINYHHHAGDMMGMSSPSAKNVDATIAGAEAGLGFALTKQLGIDANVAYAWGRNDTARTALAQIAPPEGRIHLSYATDRYSAGALLRLVAAQNRVALGQGNIVGYDMAPSAGFATLALNAAVQLSPRLNWAVGIDNVLDKTYTEHLNKAGASQFGYAQREQLNNPGRNYWSRISLKF